MVKQHGRNNVLLISDQNNERIKSIAKKKRLSTQIPINGKWINY